MNKDININKNKAAPEVAGALGDMLTDSTSQITVIITESANLKNYDLLTIHWASLSEESTDKSYPLPITKEKAGKSYSYVISEEKIKKINSIAKRLNFDDIIYMSYSIDFRRKVIFTMEEEGLSFRETAKQFRIGSASV